MVTRRKGTSMCEKKVWTDGAEATGEIHRKEMNFGFCLTPHIHGRYRSW
jgi:hypothetical protein